MCRRTGSPAICVVQMLVVLARDIGRALRVLVRSGCLERLTHEDGPGGGTTVGGEMLLDAPSNRLGQGNAALLRPPLQPAMLVRGELDLGTHHNVIVVL